MSTTHNGNKGWEGTATVNWRHWGFSCEGLSLKVMRDGVGWCINAPLTAPGALKMLSLKPRALEWKDRPINPITQKPKAEDTVQGKNIKI